MSINSSALLAFPPQAPCARPPRLLPRAARQNFLRFAVVWTLLAGVRGCSAQSSEKAAIPSKKIVIPSGTLIKMVLIDAMSTNERSPSDHKVRGRIFELREPGLMNARATLRLMLTEIMYEDLIIAIRTDNFKAAVQPERDQDIRDGRKARLDFILATAVQIWTPGQP